MKMGLYSCFDVKTGVYMPPVLCHNDEHAARVFAGAFSDEKSHFFLFPSDFRVSKIGEFDDVTGEVNGILPVYLWSLADLKSGMKKE